MLKRRILYCSDTQTLEHGLSVTAAGHALLYYIINMCKYYN